MKVSLAVAAALAASTSSLSLSLFEPQILELVNNPEAPHTGAPPHTWQTVKSHGGKPCHGAKPHVGPSTYFPGPIGALLSHLGFTPRERGHRSHAQLEVVSALKDEVASHRHMESFKEQVEEMIHRVEAETVPLMEGGMVKILPIFNELGDVASPEQVGKAQMDHHFRFDHAGKVEPNESEMRVIRIGHAGRVESIDESEMRMIQWESMAGKDGIKAVHHKHGHGYEHGHGHHRHHPKTFGWRLNHALKALRPAESLSLAFVIGAGIGSLLHFAFMIVLLSIRRLRCGRHSERARAQRRAARAIRSAERAERKAERKLARKEAKEVRFVDEDGEVLPAYGEGEQDRLVEPVEKA